MFLLGAVLAVAVAAVVGRLTGFAAQTTADYAALQPAFDIRERLNGPMVCEGVVFGPFGRVTARFVAEFRASWQGNVGTMDEEFHYDSGVIQQRQWILMLGADGAIEARAADVVGTGRGHQAGNAVLLTYRIKLAASAGGHVLDTTDWMYLCANGTIMNRSQFRKYGIKVAELVATMRPKPA